MKSTLNLFTKLTDNLLNIGSIFCQDHFSVGDIVWAKYYREPYWPAVVSFPHLFGSLYNVITFMKRRNSSMKLSIQTM